MKHGIITRIKLASSSERGVVLPVVIGLGLAMLLLVAVGMSSAASGTIKTNNDEDIKGAISAAYAGVEEYQSRLALDSTYYKFGNPTAPFSLTSAAGLSVPTTANYNPAFDSTSSGNWAEIPNPAYPATDPNPHTGSFFRYEVDNSDYASKGVIRLLSTGKVGNVTESVVASLKQSGFLDFLYFTDYETTDPIFNTDQTLDCAEYVYDGRDSDCGQIQFGKFDTLAGPVHSNDTLLICSTTFLGTLTTSNPNTPRYQTVSGNGCGGPVFKNPDGPGGTAGSANPSGAVNYEKPLTIPPTNQNMISETYTDDAANVPNPGCLYTGPTTIKFLSNGKMTVWSPYSKAVETNSTQTVATTGPAVDNKCGAISDLKSPAGATIPVVDLNLIYVQAVPNNGNLNSWTATATPSGLTCLTQSGTSYRNVTVNGNSSTIAVSTYSGGFSMATTPTATRYPAVNEVLPWTSTATNPAYSCRAGDLYVSGTVKGHMTAASDNYIYVTDDLTYNDRTSDILGLVPLNALWVFNPVIKSGSTYSYKTGSDLEIDAALLSVKHTVQVQNYDGAVKGLAPNNGAALGARGTLTIFGAIAQKFRGTVATSSGSTVATGYSKNYQYDTRFHNTAPPKFLTPVSTTYKVSQYSGTKAAYKPDGTPIP